MEEEGLMEGEEEEEEEEGLMEEEEEGGSLIRSPDSGLHQES